MSDSHSSRPVCLVTGGAKRIGKAVAQGLADSFDLAIHANRSMADAESLARTFSAGETRAAAFHADFAEPESAADMVDAVANHFGRLDLVVNSASSFEYDSPSEFSASQMQTMLSINLTAQMVVARAFGKVGSSRATLVQLLDNKVFAPNPDFFSYSVAKFALKGAVAMLAQHYRGRMRVCGIAPSNTLISGNQTEAEFATGWARTLTGAGPTPQDIASAVRFIWETTSFNGSTIVLDGGQQLMSLERDVAFDPMKS